MKTFKSQYLALGTAALLLSVGVSACGGESDAMPEVEVSENEELHAMLPQEIQDAGQIKVGTEAFYPPHAYFDEDNETIIGIDAVLTEAAGKELGVDTPIEHTAWDGLLPALTAGRYDMVIGAVTINSERLDLYDFVSFFTTDQAFTVSKGNPEGISELEEICGMPIAVLEASPQENLLHEYNEEMCADNPITVQAFPSDGDALLQLKNGRAKLHFAQRPVAYYNVQTVGSGDTFEVLDLGAVEPSTLGFVFRKDTPELRDAVHAALNEMIDNGAYGDILEGLDQSAGAITESKVYTEPGDL